VNQWLIIHHSLRKVVKKTLKTSGCDVGELC
jgi:hypothetical protein